MSGSGQHFETLEIPGPFTAPRLQTAALVMIALGAVTFLGLLATGHAERAWSSLLQGMLIPTWVGLGALFYIAGHSASNARWYIPLRRVMEGLSAGLPITFGAFVLIAAFGGNYLYDWFYASGSGAHDELFHVHGGTKSLLMTSWMWGIRTALFIGSWIFLRNKLVGLSLAQDSSKEYIRPVHNKWSIAYLIVFAMTFTFFVWDNLLSLHLHWFSTMWGPYCFTSAVQTFLCVLVLVMLWLRKGPMKQHIQEHTVHDVGTWMVGWSCFCAYLGFAQFMLIWYANMDEETFFYVIRSQHGYGWAYAAEALIRWPLPFLGLMSQSVRTKPWALTTIAIAVLVGNWMDWSWIIMPAFSQNAYRCFCSLQEVLIGAGFAGGMLLMALNFWKRHGLIPKGDPHLLATINAEHLH